MRKNINNNIKVLHLVSGNFNGGAARGAYWLHLGLNDLDVRSKILTNSILTSEYNSVKSTSRSRMSVFIKRLKTIFDRYSPKLLYKLNSNTAFSTGLLGIDITKTVEYKEADIIHLHWINDSFISIKTLSKIKKPLVWTLRDMWPMTGGCHYSLECTKYESSCDNCPQLDSNKNIDLSSIIFNRKLKYFPKNIRIVGISNWISNIARESRIFRNSEIITINNSIDCNLFFPIDKIVARKKINLITKKKIVLVGAQHLNAYYKGFEKFLKAIQKLDKNSVYICFFGNLADKDISNFDFDFEYKNFGFVNDTNFLQLLYSAADVFVAPSLMDAFGKTLVESMACGTPVVCFDATGPGGIVNHRSDGYKAKPFDIEDLAYGIKWVLENSQKNELCKLARNNATTNFDTKVSSKKYLSLYNEIIQLQTIDSI